MRLNVENHWYRASHSLLAFSLLPLSFLFGVGVSVRRALYRSGLKKMYYAPVPVIVVGNITVGGTGKTPLVIWLADFLRAQGYKPAIVSRGVGGDGTRAPRWIDSSADPLAVGDEAVLLARRVSCPVVVGVDRVAVVKALVAKACCDIIISDDGLQHYRLGRQIEIALVDGVRRFGNASLLPAGPLREPVARLRQVDFVVVQQQPVLAGAHAMELQGAELIALHDANIKKSVQDFKDSLVHAVAGIGHPSRFFNHLRAQGLKVIEHSFPDHYHYQQNDLEFSDDLPVIMTEKDAVKCLNFQNKQCWYLPVTACLDEVFGKNVLKKLEEISCVTHHE